MGARAWLLVSVVRHGPPRDCGPAHHERLRRTRVVVARKTGGSETPPLRRMDGTAARAWLLVSVVRHGPPKDSGPAHHERLRRTRVVVARKTGGSGTPPLRQETEKTAGWGWVLHPGGGSTRGAGYGPPAHHERLQRPGWLLEGVVRHGPVRQAQGRLSKDSGPAHHERLGWAGTGYPQGVPLQAKTNRHPDLGG